MTQPRFLNLSDGEVWARWRSDLAGIFNELMETFALRRQFRDFSELFRENERLRETGGHIWTWMLICYASALLIRIRRHVEGQTNEISLNRLLTEIEQRPEVITRARVFEHGLPGAELAIREDMARRHNKQFTADWAGGDPHRQSIVADVPRADRGRLTNISRAVAQVANVHIAHRTRAVKVEDITLADVDEVLETIEEVFKKYYALIDGRALFGLEPVPQFNTHEVFSFPWFVPKLPTSDES